MAIMTNDLINKNFTTTQLRRGYYEQEVDDFLKQTADEIAEAALAVGVPAAPSDEGQGTAETDGAAAAGLGSVAGVLGLAQKLHDEYVAEGQTTR